MCFTSRHSTPPSYIYILYPPVWVLNNGNPIRFYQVLHQPRYEIYAQFDDLLLLGKGGFTAFTGETPMAVPYFEKLGFKKDPNTNPADFVMDALCGMGDGPEIDFEGVFTPPLSLSRCTGQPSPF